MPRTTMACLAAFGALACMPTWTPVATAHAEVPGPSLPTVSRDDSDRMLVVGRVTNNPRKDYPRFKAFADYLSARLGDQGITGSRIQFTHDNDTMVALLREGVVDLIPESIFSAVTYADKAGAELILREWRDGVASYHSVLFAKKDSGITDLSDLLGKTIAFEDPGSTTAYFVPRAELKGAELKLVELSGPDQEPSPDAVGYVLAGSENNIVTWVHRGLVDAGAFSNIDWDQDQDLPPELRKDFTIFHRSEPLPRSVVVVRGDLPSGLERRIRQVLLGADQDPEGRAALKAYMDVARYDELTGEPAAAVAAARRILETSR
jgi:phosphonate transport system substrate-binding protein